MTSQIDELNNPKYIQQQAGQSQDSINSSEILDNQNQLMSIRTQSMTTSVHHQNQHHRNQHIGTIINKNSKITKQLDCQLNQNQVNSQDSKDNYEAGQQLFQSIEKPRYHKKQSNDTAEFNDLFQMKKQNNYSPIQFMGFFKGANKQPIQINQSKMKKAINFFDDSPIKFVQHNNKLSTNSDNSSDISEQQNDAVNFNKLKAQDQLNNTNSNYTLGFTNAYTGSTISINDQTSNKVKQLFKQFDEPSIIQYSQKKPTKLKLHQNYNKNTNHLLKTVTFQHKKNITKTNIPKKIQQSKQHGIITEINLKSLKQYQSIRLQELPEVSQNQLKEFDNFWVDENQFLLSEKQQNFNHQKNICEIRCCYFCKKYCNQSNSNVNRNLENKISKQIIIQQLIKIIVPINGKSITGNILQLKQLLTNLYIIVIFKLLRYQKLYPSIQLYNKIYNPNNILLEIYKKYQIITKNSNENNNINNFGALAESVRQIQRSNGKILGRCINLVVMAIDQCLQLKNIYVLLCDGWSYAYAIISSKNQLYPILSRNTFDDQKQVYKKGKKRKLYVGQKISIIDWNIYFVQNILEHHPNKTILNFNKQIPAIQFHHNNSKLIALNSKLGFTQNILYRSIRKCKVNGGLLPLVQGIIVRMFTRKSNKKTENLIEILLTNEQNEPKQQKQTILMKFPLPEEMTLADFFNLYTCYHFRKIKLQILANHQKYLEFYDKSAYYDIKKTSERTGKMQKLLKSRLVNIKPKQKMLQDQYGKYIDIIVTQNKFEINGKNYQIEGNSTITRNPVLLQQFLIEFQGKNSYLIKKGDRGAQLSRIPKIYQNFDYFVL